MTDLYISTTQLRRSREERRVSISGYLYVQDAPCFFQFLVPVSSLCLRQLAYILYESWLLGVFRIYTTLKPRSAIGQLAAANVL